MKKLNNLDNIQPGFYNITKSFLQEIDQNKNIKSKPFIDTWEYTLPNELKFIPVKSITTFTKNKQVLDFNNDLYQIKKSFPRSTQNKDFKNYLKQNNIIQQTIITIEVY